MPVIVYTSDACKFCDKVKDFLKSNNVQFEERNAKDDPRYTKEVFAKSGGYGVPVTDVDGVIIIGFNVKKLKEALKLQ